MPVFRTTLIVGLGLLIAWQVVTRSIAAYLAREAPQAALKLNAGEPTALVNLADARLNRRTGEEANSAGAAEQTSSDKGQPPRAGDRLGGWAEIALKAMARRLEEGQALPDDANAPPPLTQQDRAQIRAFAERALRNDPLNARALRVLGQLAEVSGDRDLAARLMGASARRSLGESAAVYAMLRHSFENKDHVNTLYYADALMRKRPQLVGAVAPMLASSASGRNCNHV